MKNSKWYKTLNFFLNKGYITNGLTLPFLIGLYTKEEISIKEILIQMCNVNVISIQKCPRINEFVFGILILESDQELKHYKSLDGIFLIDHSLDKFDTIDDLTEYFEEIYLSKINNNYFSKNNGLWSYYNEEDKSRLKSLEITE